MAACPGLLFAGSCATEVLPAGADLPRADISAIRGLEPNAALVGQTSGSCTFIAARQSGALVVELSTRAPASLHLVSPSGTTTTTEQLPNLLAVQAAAQFDCGWVLQEPRCADADTATGRTLR